MHTDTKSSHGKSRYKLYLFAALLASAGLLSACASGGGAAPMVQMGK